MGTRWRVEYQHRWFWNDNADRRGFDATNCITWNKFRAEWIGVASIYTVGMGRHCIGGSVDLQTIKPLDWSAQLVADFQPSIEANPWRHGTAFEVLQGSMAFEVTQDASRALVAVRPVSSSAGKRLDVMGLVSTGDRLDALDFDAAVTSIAKQIGAKQLAMATIHPHIARACQRAGWIQTGQLMIKILEQPQ